MNTRTNQTRSGKSNTETSILDADTDFEMFFPVNRLRRCWRNLRKELRQLTVRDPVDWVDWSMAIDKNLQDIRQHILDGTYQPLPPTRYEEPKSQGSFRLISTYNVRDALIYRLLSDDIYDRYLPVKVPGAFFSRRFSATPIGETLSIEEDNYSKFFQVWLHFNQYRTRTLLNRPFDIVAITDITNYFDSIEHDLLLEYLAPLGLPRKAMALLGRLLEAFRPPAGHSPNPRVGLAADEIECSIQLAHVFLFEHDQRVIDRYGKDSYVRWMDDQAIGIQSMSEARQAVNHLTRSLSSQRLTLNSAKTRLLSPDDLVEYFQLEANQRLDDWTCSWAPNGQVESKHREDAKRELEGIWGDLSSGVTCGKGVWEKVVKRVYWFAIITEATFLDDHMHAHLIQWPQLADRIFQALALRNETKKLLNLFMKYGQDGENLYETTEARFFERCLMLDPNESEETDLVEFSREFVTGKSALATKRPLGRSTALLLIYWLDGNILTTSDDLFRTGASLPKEVARALLAVIAAREPKRIRVAQAHLLGNPSDDVARLGRFLSNVRNGAVNSLGNYRKLRYIPVRGFYYDCRTWLMLELLANSANPQARKTAQADLKNHFLRYVKTRPEFRVAERLQTKLGMKPTP